MSNICARARVYLVVTTFLSWAWRAMAVAAPMMLANAGPARASGYDPLAVDAAFRGRRIVDLTVHDAARNRDIPLRVYLPTNTAPAPVVLFSHGLGGSRTGSVFLGEHWAARGYVAVFLQHPGSDDSVWKDKPVRGADAGDESGGFAG